MHQKEQHEHRDYYKKIGEAIRNYQDVLLFGPTTAKTELFNMLKADHHFEKIKLSTLHLLPKVSGRMILALSPI